MQQASNSAQFAASVVGQVADSDRNSYFNKLVAFHSSSPCTGLWVKKSVVMGGIFEKSTSVKC